MTKLRNDKVRDMDILDKFEDRFTNLANVCYIIAGNLIYAVSINTLITPMSLYNGGFLGIAQLLRHFLVTVLHMPFPSTMDVTGIIYFLMNVPLFFYAYRAIGLKFSIKSLLSIGLSSLCLTLVPVPAEPLFEDVLTCCVVAGVIGGVGSGMILRGGSSTGGSDIIGVCMSKTHPNMSVGKLNVMVNTFVYGTCFLVFNVQIAVYSFIYTTIRSTFMDRMHTQNIMSEAVIFTKVDGIGRKIANELGHGVTMWEGKGAYTDDDVHVLDVAITKYEISQLKAIVLEEDPRAFMMFRDGESITGNFKKHIE